LNEVCEAAKEIEASPIVSAKTLVKMGSGLKQLLFSAESQKALTETQAGIIDTRMRIKLPRYRTLRSLPWEFIQVRSGKSSGFESKLTVIRELMPAKVSIGERDHEENRLVKNKPLRLRELKVLVTTVNQKPEFGQLILLEKEIEKITNVLESSKRWKTKIQPLPDPTWDDFGDEIRKGYNIVYFSGHGGVHDMAVHTDLGLKIYHENVLFFRGSDGNPLPIDQDRLVKLFAENQLKDETSRTCLVYLNACQSATVLQGVASIAESLVQQARVTAVVGMGYKITEESAIIFGEEFFKVLINQGQVDWAVREGRRKLASHIGEGSRSWGVPRLYTCTEADQLFMHI